MRARKHNVPLTFCAGAVVAHAFDPGLRGLFRQFARYGAAERQMCARHPEYLSWLSTTVEISSLGVRPPDAGGAADAHEQNGLPHAPAAKAGFAAENGTRSSVPRVHSPSVSAMRGRC